MWQSTHTVSLGREKARTPATPTEGPRSPWRNMKQEPRPNGRVPASSFLQVEIRGFPWERILRQRKMGFLTTSILSCLSPQFAGGIRWNYRNPSRVLVSKKRRDGKHIRILLEKRWRCTRNCRSLWPAEGLQNGCLQSGQGGAFLRSQ